MSGTLGSCGDRTAIKNQTSVDEVVRREDDATDGRKGETWMAGMKAYFGGNPDSQCKYKRYPVGDILLYFYLFRFLFLSAVEEEEAAAMMGWVSSSVAENSRPFLTGTPM